MQNEQEMKENLDRVPQDQESDINDDRSDTTSFVDDSDAVPQILALNRENARLSNTAIELALELAVERKRIEELQRQLAAAQAQVAAVEAARQTERDAQQRQPPAVIFREHVVLQVQLGASRAQCLASGQ